MDQKEDFISLDDMLKETLAQLAGEELDSIPSDEEIDKCYPVSDYFRMRMAKAIRRQHVIDLCRSIFRGVKRAAAAFTLIFLLTGGLLALNEDARAAVKTIVTEWFQKFTSFTFRADDNPELDFTKLRPTYLPEGYDRMDVAELGKKVKIRCYNQMEELLEITVSSENRTVNIDNEHTIKENVEVNGEIAELYKSLDTKHMSHLIFSICNDTIIVKIEGFVEPDELIRIGENLDVP